MGRRITIDALQAEISKTLDDYREGVADGMDTAVRKTARLGARALNNVSGAAFKGKKYRKSWTTQFEKSRLANVATIYSRLPGLPHLLEHGHANRGGGRTPGRTHIAPVEQELIQSFEKEVQAAIDKAGN